LHDITELLKLFFANSKTNIVFGVGAVLLLGGLFGKVVTKKESDRWRVLAVLLGLILMITGPSISFVQSNPGNLPKFLRENLADIFVIGLGFWAFSGAVLVQIQLSRLVRHEKRLIANVEDATRHVLLGIPQIFDRAYQLIKEADRELWIISFALNFGESHSAIPTIAAEYKKLTLTDSYRESTGNKRRRMEKDVEDFVTTLRKQVTDIPKVRVLTLCDNAIRDGFVTPLVKRSGYSDVYDTQSKLDGLYGQIQSAKAGILERLQHRDQSRDEKENSCAIRQVSSLPIQLFIAGIKGQARSGCLVFMVGTEILQATNSQSQANENNDGNEKPFQEPGFYTELSEVVDVYRSLAEALFLQAKGQSGPEQNVVVYEGR
jgi:hypothetical protein